MRVPYVLMIVCSTLWGGCAQDPFVPNTTVLPPDGGGSGDSGAGDTVSGDTAGDPGPGDVGPGDLGPGDPGPMCLTQVDADTVALYSFSEVGVSLVVADEVGAVDAMLMGPVAGVVGPAECGDALDTGTGAAAYAIIPDDPKWDLASGSVDFWLRLGQVPTDQWGLISRDASGTAQGGHFTAFINSAGRVVVRIQESTGTSHHLCSQVVPLDTWTHVGINFGAPGAEIWVGGERAVQMGNTITLFGNEQPCEEDITQGMDGNDNPWSVGASTHLSMEGEAEINSPLVDGQVDEFRISNARRDFSSF